MKAFRLTILLITLLSMLPMSAWYYDPNGVENPLDSDITENVRYVNYECKDARLAEIISWEDRLDWSTTKVSMTAIYCEDGIVYLNKFLYPIATISLSQGCRKYWIKGKLSEDGQYINIPVGQMVATDYFTNQQLFYPVILSSSENEPTIDADDSMDTISLHIEENGTLTPIGVDNTHGWGCFKSGREIFESVLFCNAFVPKESQPILPPPGLKKEKYEFKYATVGDSNVKFGDIGKRVNIVFVNDSIFIQGCSYLHKEGWSIGKRDGDRYIFENGNQPVGNVPLIAVTRETEEANHYSYYIIYSSSDTDLIFDTDPTSNSIVAQTGFWTESGSWMFYSEAIGTYYDNDIYLSAVFNKIPNGLQHPLPPEVTIEERSNGSSKVTVCGSYFDSNGYVMDTRKLFYRLYVDGIPYTFTKVEKWFSFDLAEPTELLPYYLLNVSVDEKDTPSLYDFEITIPSTFKEVKAELVYIQDGQEISSGVDSVYTDSDKDDDKDDIYDLTGRKVNQDTLLPGIYIKGGRKFIVK